MKTISSEQYKKMLKDCAEWNECDEFVLQFEKLVRWSVKKIFALKHIDYRNIEDAFQEVFIKLFEDNRRKLKKYNPTAGLSVPGWIKLISTQTTLNFIRNQRTGNWSEHQELPENLEDKKLNIADTVLRKKTVETLIQNLHPKEKLVVKLRYFDDLSFKEIADFMDITENHVNQLHHRALKRIREKLITDINESTSNKEK